MIASLSADPATTFPEPFAASATLLAQLSHVRKRFGPRWVLDDVDLDVRQGEVVVVLGPNGAGKTTALGILTGLRPADGGTASLFGGNPCNPEVRRALGVTPQELDFPAMLRVHELLDLVRAHYPEPLATAYLLERFGLADLRNRFSSALSGGERRRLAVALAFAGNPRLACLDEPTTGLDVESRRSVWTCVREYVASGGTVLLTTHYLEEAEALATRVVVIAHGATIFEGSVAEIKRRVGHKRVSLRANELPALHRAYDVTREGERFVLHATDADALVDELRERGVTYSDLEIQAVTLEEAFLRLTELAS
jgi:ABC-2 type transport system ATP-binding protein